MIREIEIKVDPAVEEKFANYPPKIKKKLNVLRSLIMETAAELESIDTIEETLKWNEPSYLVKKGSTIRMDWKSKSPDQYAMYFKCTSKLVPTFRQIYGDLFNYEKNRAIVFNLDDILPVEALKDCIAMALEYHLLKDQVLLGR